jgi:hypothetical protein
MAEGGFASGNMGSFGGLMGSLGGLFGGGNPVG